MEKIHIVSIISETGVIANRAFAKLDDAITYYESQKNIHQDKYSNGRRYVYLTENIHIE